MASLLTALSECRPGMLTAPGNGGSATRWTTTSIVFVVPLKVPADRMMTVLLASVVGEVSIAGAVAPLNPVSGVSVTPLSLRMETLNVPPFVAPVIAAFVSPASATHGRPVVAPASRPLQLWLPSAVFTSTLKPRSMPASARWRARDTSARLREICGSSVATER